MTTKILPHSEGVERTLLASLLSDPKVFSANVADIRPDYFYDSARRRIFEYMADKNCSDPVVIAAALPGDVEEIANCIENYASHAGLCAEIDVLKDRAYRRLLIRAGIVLIGDAEDFEETPAALLEAFTKETSAIHQHRKSFPEHIGAIMPRAIGELYQSMNRGLGIKTGLIDVDEKLGGMQPGDLVVIAARPSMGKSSLAVNIARHNTINCTTPTVIFSLEMAKNMVSNRALFAEADQSLEAAIKGMLPKSGFDRLNEHMTKLADSPLWIDDTPGIGMQEIAAKTRSLIAQHGIKLLIIDHAQLMGVTRGRSRNEEVSEITAGLKNLARDCEIVVVALSQLSRECEKRSPPRPMLSDLRDSGSIEQDADRVVFIYRDEVYNRADAEKGIAEIIIAKNRNGRTGMVKTLFDGNSMQFKSLAKENSGFEPDGRNA